MEEYIKYVVTFLSGGVVGTILNNVISNHKNKIQLMDCEYLEDDIISKLPIVYEKDSHKNLHSKKFKITNTTNKDIEQIKLLFSFEEQSKIVKHICTTKAGVNFPVGKIFKSQNEITYYLKKFNRQETAEFYFEIGDIQDNKFNVTELDILGVKIHYVDKRTNKRKDIVKMVHKKELIQK